MSSFGGEAGSGDERDIGLTVGQVLDGKFRVERIVGEGAMGLVVEATHLALEERVALKFLNRAARADADIVARFAREARASARIKNVHVAEVYDVGGAEQGLPFMVMELLEGSDLEEVLQRRGPLDPSEATEYVIQACEGLAAAHALGIVHRDIKPANLFVTDHGGPRVKLLDFGISKGGTLDDIDVSSVKTTKIMGSPHYMSPEQIRSTKDVDHRADLWSLGVVLFELLTNDMPFDATEVTAIIAQVLHASPRDVRSLVPTLPAELAEIIARCLKKDPERRYATAGDLAMALAPFAPKRARVVAERAAALACSGANAQAADSYPPPPLVSRSPGATSSNAVGPVMITAAVPTSVPRARYRVLPFALAGLALVGVGLAFAWLRETSSTSPSEAVASGPRTEAALPTTSGSESEVAASPAVDAAASASAVSAPAPSTAPPTVAASKPARAAASAHRPHRPAGRPSGTSASEPAIDTDIRRER